MTKNQLEIGRLPEDIGSVSEISTAFSLREELANFDTPYQSDSQIPPEIVAFLSGKWNYQDAILFRFWTLAQVVFKGADPELEQSANCHCLNYCCKAYIL